ncbi:MAG: tetratricopeptide repeat protein [Lentimicrobium sp.]|jgi:outer membrane protein assembly factor BamD (BamD/ComL family)|nr:tetratricopeptide repeat protein [Lentimicrobium sp.]MDD2528000.1 tetratricopeptide repeat protein [Lentimicrobiaceae bacterium]MDD4597220.1 tetratricopeptide repeat protein [Lentimicrobiaceae bacterium]MDY0025643.1 tetratricopeptide repeat protein [Lentimicrobium sp.]HAH58517.1 hypothetical protein [Bacteroidales bacterium]
MNNKSIALLLVAAFAALISCTSGLDKDVERLTRLEKNIDASDARPEQAKLNELLEEYQKFVNEHPDDSLAPTFLYKAITLSMSMNQGEKAIALSDRMINEYSKSKHIPEVIFLKGFIYENFQSNYAQALKSYQDFIKMFPNHELTDDAEAAIANLGKSPDEMVREFERKAAEAGQ